MPTPAPVPISSTAVTSDSSALVEPPMSTPSPPTAAVACAPLSKSQPPSIYAPLLAAGVTKNNTDRIRAGDLINFVAEQVGGKGGGRPDFAQAGGTNPDGLDAALKSVPGWVSEHLN